jgi:serine/threonine protein kinase
MSPEQSVDPTSVGTHADIYSLGATLFWLLTGHPPYEPASSLAEAVKRLQEQAPRSLSKFRPDAPPELEAFVMRMLDRDPLRRPPMALTIIKALEPFATR